MKKISLVDNLKVQVQPGHIERLRIIDNEDYSGVLRKTKEILITSGKRVSDEYLNRGLEALKL
jgi:hypothetical protein